MHIRPETAADAAVIAALTTAAFAHADHSNGTEAEIIARLRADGDLTLSLVAEQAGEIIGHIAFSPVTINGEQKGWFGLGPVSVHPDYQRQGIGSALINAGLEQIHTAAAQGCVLLGNPAYYSRFGFEPCPNLRYPHAPAEYFMALLLGGASVPSGEVHYAPAFSA